MAVELLLFEWKPRSAVPVALASVTAGVARRYVLGQVHCSPYRLIRSSLGRRVSADEPLRAVVHRIVESGVKSMPVFDNRVLVGEISLDDLLQARTKNLEEEQSRERVLHLRIPFRTLRDPVNYE